MGWKIYLLAISDCNENDINLAHQLLINGNEGPTSNTNLIKAQFLDKTSIGYYDGKLFVVAPNLIDTFFNEVASGLEKQFALNFPKSEILVLEYYSTVDLYGFSLIKNGERIRTKAGADLETFVDFGSKLPEEIEIEGEKIFDDEDLEEMEEDEQQAALEQERGIRTVFRLTKRLFKKQIDESGSLAESIEVQTY
jgi:hypothetical protein